MKRKNYFSFAIGRIIAGLLIGAIIYLSTVSYLKSIYDQSVRDGFDTITEKYGTMTKAIRPAAQIAAMTASVTSSLADGARCSKRRKNGSIMRIITMTLLR